MGILRCQDLEVSLFVWMSPMVTLLSAYVCGGCIDYIVHFYTCDKVAKSCGVFTNMECCFGFSICQICCYGRLNVTDPERDHAIQ